MLSIICSECGIKNVLTDVRLERPHTIEYVCACGNEIHITRATTDIRLGVRAEEKRPIGESGETVSSVASQAGEA